MNKFIRLIVALVAIGVYFVLLRYVAPSREPYFVLGVALIGLVAWFFGIAAGIATGLLLIPATLYIYSQFSVSTSYLNFAASPAYIALELLTAIVLGRLRRTKRILVQKETDLSSANENLQNALSEVRELGGVHSLCTGCKKILDDDGNWKKIDTYLKEKTKAKFSHGICPGCAHEYTEQLDEQPREDPPHISPSI